MKNNNNLYHLLIFILSLGGVFLTFDMHFVDTIVGSCGGRCECSFNTFAPLGISNIYWGILYYFSLTVLGLIPIIPKLNNYSKEKNVFDITEYYTSLDYNILFQIGCGMTTSEYNSPECVRYFNNGNCDYYS